MPEVPAETGKIHNMYSLRNKVVLITGASSGIGRATALEAARQGARLGLAARNQEELNKLVSEIRLMGSEAEAFRTDVSVESECMSFIEAALARFGTIDVLINNAGISMRALFLKTDTEVLRRLMAVNFWGTVYCTKYALTALLASGGSVVGVSSIAGYKGLPGRTGYSASKFAMQGFLEALRIENLKTGLHVLIACPGFTTSNIRNTALSADGTQQGESPRNEAGMMAAEEVAIHILKAVTKRKNSIVLTRQGKLTVWLSKWFPALTDKLVFNHMAKEPDAPFK